MLRKGFNYFLIAAAVLTVWKLSDGNLGNFLISTWDNILYPALDASSEWLMTIWRTFFG